MIIPLEFHVTSHDLAALHDSVYEAIGTSQTEEQLIETFKDLPKWVQAIAFAHGMSDTEFGEAVYDYMAP